MAATRFAGVFQKLGQAAEADAAPVPGLEFVDQELDEIDALRRLAQDVAEPELRSYTVT